MHAFLIITSLSLAFYLGLLVVLYHDGRKRRMKVGSARKVKLGTVADLSTSRFASSPTVRETPGAVIYSVETSRRRGGQQRVKAGEEAKVITLSRLARGKNDLQCG